jgi:hypothetical protein
VTYDYTPVPLPAALPLPVAPLGNLGLSSSWWDTATGQTPTTVTGDGSNDGTLPGLVNDLSANAASTYMFSHAYSGQLDIASVPVPAALPLLLSGLAGLGFKIRRR